MMDIYCDKKKYLNCIKDLFFLLVFTAVVTSFVYAAEEDGNIVVNTEITNTYCPVMPEMQTNPEIYTDYKSKRIYFCCDTCKAAFGKEPGKYLSLLPQFGGTLTQKTYRHEYKLEFKKLIEPMGIITLSMLVLTVLTSLLRRKNPKFLLRWHKRLGIITLVAAFIHATLVLIAH